MVRGGRTETRYIWDIPTRAFHWLLVGFVTAGWILGEFGPFVKTWHFYCGYAVGTLVVLRVLRGLFGGPPVSFASFLYGPRAVLAYARAMFAREPSHWPGHNPMGGLSVFAMLASLAVQVGTGLFADDEILNQGPFAGLVDTGTRNTLTAIHEINSRVILALVALHVAVLLFYLFWKRENLIRPMVTGNKTVDPAHEG